MHIMCCPLLIPTSRGNYTYSKRIYQNLHTHIHSDAIPLESIADSSWGTLPNPYHKAHKWGNGTAPIVNEMNKEATAEVHRSQQFYNSLAIFNRPWYLFMVPASPLAASQYRANSSTKSCFNTSWLSEDVHGDLDSWKEQQ